MNDHVSAEDFAAYLDGMLRPEHKTELENHFSGCPACLDELLEIAGIMDGRQGKIPAEFLKLALGEKTKTAKSVLNLRLAFEIAAVFVVVVFMGYLFLDNNRFWQTPEQQKPAVMLEKDLGPGDTSPAVRAAKMAPLPAKQRERADAREIKSEQSKADVDQRFADSLVSEKRKNIVGYKGLPAAKPACVKTPAQEDKLQEIAAELSQPVAEKEKLAKKELAQTAAVPETVGAARLDFSANEMRAAKVKEKKAGAVAQNLEAQKEPGAGVALPIEAKVKESKLQDEESMLRSPIAVPESAGADKQASEDNKRDVALTRKEIAGKGPLFPWRIEGDVVWSDLRNPELFFAWTWFPKGLALELQIDGAGTVTAVVPLGKSDPAIARQAQNEAKKLLFSVSKNKSRRAGLVAD